MCEKKQRVCAGSVASGEAERARPLMVGCAVSATQSEPQVQSLGGSVSGGSTGTGRSEASGHLG